MAEVNGKPIICESLSNPKPPDKMSDYVNNGSNLAAKHFVQKLGK